MKVKAHPPCTCGSKRARAIESGPFRVEGKPGLYTLPGLKCQNCGRKRTRLGKDWPFEADLASPGAPS